MLSGTRAGLVAALLALSAGPAAAAPITLWLKSDFGFDAGTASTALSASLSVLPDSEFFANPEHGVTLISITTPSQIPGTLVSSPSRSNPNRGTSVWTVTAVDQAFEDLWIVIQGQALGTPSGEPPSGFYSNVNVGLQIDPADPHWALVHPYGATDYTYLAYFVGDLPKGAQHEIPIDYRVAQALYVSSSNSELRIFPQFRANFLELSVPEPGLGSMLLLASVGLAGRRRRRAR